jgi:hypothetical protein
VLLEHFECDTCDERLGDSGPDGSKGSLISAYFFGARRSIRLNAADIASSTDKNESEKNASFRDRPILNLKRPDRPNMETRILRYVRASAPLACRFHLERSTNRNSRPARFFTLVSSPSASYPVHRFGAQVLPTSNGWSRDGCVMR